MKITLTDLHTAIIFLENQFSQLIEPTRNPMKEPEADFNFRYIKYHELKSGLEKDIDILRSRRKKLLADIITDSYKVMS